MIKNVLPFFLDGGIQSISNSEDWNGTSSFVQVDTSGGAVILTLKDTDEYGKPIRHGVMVVVTKSAGDTFGVVINCDSDFSTGSTDTLLTFLNDSALYLYKGPSDSNDKGEWVLLSKFQKNTDEQDLSGYAPLAGADFTGSLTVGTDLVEFDVDSSAIGFFGEPAVAQQTDPVELIDSTTGTAATDNTLVAVTDTLSNNNFATLAREVEALRSSLVAYGLLG